MNTFNNKYFNGNLIVEDVYCYYDCPRLFTAIGPDKTRFLVDNIEDEPDHMSYLLIPVSDARYEELKAGTIDLRKAFTEPEDGKAYLMLAEYNRNYTTTQEIDPKTLNDEFLPETGTLLTK